jgi:hypothetical protein
VEPSEALGQDQEILHLLQPGERVELRLDAASYQLRVTDRRMLLTNAGSVRLDIPYERLRRIEFDIEAERPATLVIVPHLPADEPQVLSVPHESLHHAAELLAFVGERLRARRHDGGNVP